MSPTTTLISHCLTLLLLLSSAAALTAYDVLQNYDFPVGLLPEGVTGYDLNETTGEFAVYLPEKCQFPIESYQLEYKTTITGVISKDKLTNLKGVSVKVLLLWLNIVEVVKEGDELQFSVGIASANFPLEGFEESPTCGCGFDCSNGSLLHQRIQFNPLVSW